MAVVSKFDFKPTTLADEIRAGGRINLIIGRGLTAKAREVLGMPKEEIFSKPQSPKSSAKGFTLAQKMVGRACGVEGILPELTASHSLPPWEVKILQEQ